MNRERLIAQRREYARRFPERVAAQKAASYRRNFPKIRERNKAKYRANPTPAKIRAKIWYNENKEMALARAAQYRDTHRRELAMKQIARYWASHDEHKRRHAIIRQKNRLKIRAGAAKESANLTDSYVRNQLSKYSEKSTHEWSQEEVEAKRAVMIANHEKKARYKAHRAIPAEAPFCRCGCGQQTKRVQYDDPKRGLKAGEFNRFVFGHRPRKPAGERSQTDT